MNLVFEVGNKNEEITFGKTWSRTSTACLEFQPEYPRKTMSAYTWYKINDQLHRTPNKKLI